MIPDLAGVLASAVPFALPLRVPFRGVTRRVGLLLPGPAGWGEFAPFPDYPPRLAARWLAAGLEAAYTGWPAPVRASVGVNAIVPDVPAEEIARSIPPGARTVKVKVTGRLSADLERVAAVRAAAGPAAALRLDANGGWTLDDAIGALPALQEAAGAIEYVEQPLPDLADMQRLREAVGIPIAVDESLRLAPDPFDPALLSTVRAVADVAVLKVAPLGGVAATMRLARLLGMPAVVSSALDTSIGLSAGVAAACALADPPLDCGLGTAALFADDVVVPPLAPGDGRLSAMRVRPDPDALSRAAAAIEPEAEASLRDRLAEAWRYR